MKANAAAICYLFMLGTRMHMHTQLVRMGLFPQLIAVFISERLLPVAHPTLVGKNHASMYNNQA